MAKPVILTSKQNTEPLLMKNDSGADAKAGDFVFIKAAGGGFDITANGEDVHGIAAADIANGAIGVIDFIVSAAPAWVDLAAAFDPDIGDRVAAASATTVDAGAGSDPVIGIVIEKNPAASARAKILLLNSLMNEATT